MEWPFVFWWWSYGAGWEGFTYPLHHDPFLLMTMFLFGCVRHSGSICRGPPSVLKLGDTLGEALATPTFGLPLYMAGFTEVSSFWMINNAFQIKPHFGASKFPPLLCLCKQHLKEH